MIPAEYPDHDRPALLIVEDEFVLLQTLAACFERAGYEVSTAATVREAQTRYWSRQKWDAILSDFHLPDGTGLEFCQWTRKQHAASPPFLIMSGAAGAGEVIGVEFIAKPFTLSQLEKRVQALFQGGVSEPSCAYG